MSVCAYVRVCVLGFGDRLLSEVKKLAPKDVKIKVCHFTVKLKLT